MSTLFTFFRVLSHVLLLVVHRSLWLLVPPPPLVVRLAIAPTVPAGSHVIGKQGRQLMLVLLVMLVLLLLLVVVRWKRGWGSVGALSISSASTSSASTSSSCTVGPLLILVPQFSRCIKVLSIRWGWLLLLWQPLLLLFPTQFHGGMCQRMRTSRKRSRRLDGGRGRARCGGREIAWRWCRLWWKGLGQTG